MSQLTSIPEFYNGKGVFITGGTGFLGKVLVEKLLRSCSGIENIYLLIHSTKDTNIKKSLEELKSSQIFDILRDQDAQALNKIILIEGDTSKIGLGISKENRDLLCNKVSIIFHSAATVRFIETLKNAVNTNLRALDEMLKLSRELKNLESFVHISTAYSNWFEPVMKEEFYPAAFDPYYIINLCNSTPDDQLKEMTRKLLEKHPNVYTFTKGLAEHLAMKTANDLPFAIVRPSIVGSSIKEPKVGWVDSYTAITPLVDQTSRGVLRSFHCNKNYVVDVIPVDMVINLTIAVSWKVANDKASKNSNSMTNIFNSVSGNTNPLLIKEMYKYSRDSGRRNPSDLMRWYPQTRFYKTKMLYKIDSFLTHYIPALLSDALAKLKGQNGKSVSFNRKVQFGVSQTDFVMNNSLYFHAENYQKVFAAMNKVDQTAFFFNPRTINWKNYFDDFYFGIRKFIYHDKSMGTEAARKRFTRLKYANYILSASIIALSLIAARKIGDKIISRNEENVTSSYT